MDRESDVGSSEAGSGRDTPRSLDHEPYGTGNSYPTGPIPQYRYSQDELYDLEKAPASTCIPACLSKDCMVDGVWDPERWSRSIGGGGGGSRGPSPQIVADMKERRIERDSTRRHSMSERSADPKERLKEEKDGIILSPQRRSFGTGCHVSHQPLLQRALSNIVDYKEGDGTRNPRRIGSGRIAVDTRTERDFRSDRQPERGEFRNSEREREYTRRESERDNREFPRNSEREREYRNSDSQYRNEYSRDNRFSERDREHRNNREPDTRGGERDYRNSRDSRDRFEREDRHNRDARFERDRIFVSRRDVDERARDRDFRDFSNRTSRGGRGRHEEEPEWFSSGPISKNDTIELHGFEKEKKQRAYSESCVTEMEKGVLHDVTEDDHEEEEEVKINNEGYSTSAISVADRNGSLETNESSSPETNQSDTGRRLAQNTSPSSSLFDFSEFFKVENLPGLVDDPVVEPPSNLGGSRFYQLYKVSGAGNHSGPRGSRENSRRSSFNEEFGYLNEMLNGSKSPVIPSPPPPSANSDFEGSGFLTPYASHDKQQHIEFGTVGQKLSNNPFVSALINNAAAMERSRNSPSDGNRNTHDTEARLKALLFGRLDSQSSSGTASPGYNSPLNVPGKVKTLAELEADLQHSGKPIHLQGGGMARRTPPPQPAHSTPQYPPGRPREENDLTAFNKLISLMKAGAATPVESPKLAMKSEQRPPTPVMSLPQMVSGHHVQQQPPPAPPQPVHRPEPIPIHDQFIQQNGRPADMQFGEMDGFSGPGQPPRPQDPTDVNTAQKQFFEALQRNKEQQLQIRQATMQSIRLQAPPGSSGGPAQSQMAPPIQMPNAQPPPQGMPVRRLSNGDPIVNFLKANPTIITKAASPTPPPQQLSGPPRMVQHAGTPRGPSPSPIQLQQALLSQQAAGSPRVPSPIIFSTRYGAPRRAVFSQQPPMHLSAPSPIHPSQSGPLSQSPTNAPGSTSTTNSIRPPSVQRVPSPQELIVHTQAILQNALIKKQLEDQKERFYKKQQDRGKSPNPLPPGTVLPLRPDGMQPIASTPITKTPVNVAFTPTSVIRKMHSEKVQRRESIDRTDGDTPDLTSKDDRVFFPQQETTMAMNPNADIPEPLLPMDGDVLLGPPPHIHTNIPPPQLMATVPPPLLPNQVLSNMIPLSGPQALLPAQLTHLPPPPHVSTNLPPPMLSPVTAPGGQVTAVMAGPPLPTNLVSQEQSEAVQAQFRAMMNQVPMPPGSNVQVHIVTSSQQTPGRPIVGVPKGTMNPMAQTVTTTTLQQQMGPSVAHNKDTPYPHRPIFGVNRNTPVPGPIDMNKLLQQQQQQQHSNSTPNLSARPPQGTPGTQYGIPVTGRFPLQPGPGLPPQPPTPGTNPVFVQPVMTPGNHRAVNQQFAQMAALQAQQQRMMDPRMAGAVRPPGVVPQMLSPRTPDSYNSPHAAPFNPRTLNTQVSMQKSVNCPISPGVAPMLVGLNGNNNLLKQENANLMKWFGTDMLKTQLPTMPPLPVQGQRVMTVDEIERT